MKRNLLIIFLLLCSVSVFAIDEYVELGDASYYTTSEHGR